MSKVDVIRAWKDEEYRSSLRAAELGALPANPAGMIDLSEIELSAVAGGTEGVVYTGCTQPCTFQGCPTLAGPYDVTLTIFSWLSLCMCICLAEIV